MSVLFSFKHRCQWCFRRGVVLHSWMLSFKFFCFGMYFHMYCQLIKYLIVLLLMQFYSAGVVTWSFCQLLNTWSAFRNNVFIPWSKNILLSPTEGETFGVDWRDCARLCQHLSSSLSIRQPSRCPAALLSFDFCHSHDTSAELHCQCVGETLLHVQCVWEVLEKRRRDSFHFISINQFVWVFKNDSLIHLSHHTRSRL